MTYDMTHAMQSLHVIDRSNGWDATAARSTDADARMRDERNEKSTETHGDDIARDDETTPRRTTNATTNNEETETNGGDDDEDDDDDGGDDDDRGRCDGDATAMEIDEDLRRDSWRCTEGTVSVDWQSREGARDRRARATRGGGRERLRRFLG